MELKTLKANSRATTGSANARRLRREGFVPCVVYGGNGEPVGLQLEAREFARLLHAGRGEHAIVQLDVEDNPSLSGPAMLKEVQHHPVRGGATHADFMRISLDERIVTQVTVTLVGRAPGVVEGGVLDLIMREVEVECRALEVPESFQLDVSALGIGDSLHVSDLVVPEGITLVSEPDRMVVAVHASRLSAAAETTEEGEAAAEPEVIGGKKEED
jgi:large subunit ribosomal protein L25